MAIDIWYPGLHWFILIVTAIPYVASALVLKVLRLAALQFLLPCAIVALDLAVRIGVRLETTSSTAPVAIATTPFFSTFVLVPAALILDRALVWTFPSLAP